MFYRSRPVSPTVAALVAEPSEFDVVVAAGGSLMKRLTVRGRSAHAGRRWEGESVLLHFERIRHAFEALERERSERVTHPLYEAFDIPWPVDFGTVEAATGRRPCRRSSPPRYASGSRHTRRSTRWRRRTGVGSIG